ncbi:hypothetical protein [uncultured Roseovarius sp.]|uniref:hypothetical protein n=1 Tax=uncultured Roseovarius sp. TaxID=293344 RepID=UPI002608BCCC|nr:hypothetical protein [uncultured Roseovarius sp.]
MVPRLILHIGSPKCGSTYMQRVMLQNSSTLLEQGIRYPAPAGGHPGNAADLADITPEAVEAMFADGIHTVVLSHEDLYSLPKRGRALAGLAKDHGIEVQLLAFLRPFSDFVFGDYSQFMKQFFEKFLAERSPYGGRDFTTFAKRRISTMSPATYLRNWNKLFPERPFILDNHHNIRLTLSPLLGYPDGLDWQVPLQHTNPSLRMQDCDNLAAAMRDPSRSEADIRAMFREAFHHTQDADSGRSAERIEWLEAQFKPHNDALMTHFWFDNRHPLVRQCSDISAEQST